jgi:hypothetical protein
LPDDVHHRIIGKRLDGLHGLAVESRCKGDATPHRLAVHKHGARTADAVLACQMRSGQIVMVANEVRDRRPAFHAGFDTCAIERDR